MSKITTETRPKDKGGYESTVVITLISVLVVTRGVMAQFSSSRVAGTRDTCA